MTGQATPNPVEAKVKTTSAAAAVMGLVGAMLQLWVFKDGVPDVVEAVLTSVITPLVTGGLTFLTGWLTHHTPQ
jgi:hypothetical protein